MSKVYQPAHQVLSGGRMALTLGDYHLRSLEEALADLVEKLETLPATSRERATIERMIETLKAEIVLRARRPTSG